METKILESLVSIDQNKKTVLCSIVHQSGSIPRKDFPLMLVFENGDTIGTIGGGNLEYNVINLASSDNNNAPRIINHKMTGKDAYGDSGICGGEVIILLEPYLDQHIRHFKYVQNLLETSPAWIKTTVIDPLKKPKVSWDVVPAREENNGKRNLATPLSNSYYCTDKIIVNRYISQNSTLHIFGAGHVGHALAELAHFFNFTVNVYDDRNELLTIARYPNASERVVNPISDTLKNLKLRSSDSVIVTTRNHSQDLEIMRCLLKKTHGYVGLVSSRRKWILIKKALLNEGFGEDAIKSVYAPTGLDIGADTVPEIALSIISEILYYNKKKQQSIISLSRKHTR
ncbi:MAG: XdhC family protein [Fidelibacterota bacterium]